MSDLQQPYDAVLAESTTSGSTMACSTGYCQCAAKDARIAELEAKCLGLAGQSAERGNRMVEMRQRIGELEAELSRQSEAIQRDYPTPLQWAQAQQRIAELEGNLAAARDEIAEDGQLYAARCGAIERRNERIRELEAEAAGLRGVVRQVVNDILAARAVADPRLRFWEVQFNLRDLRELQQIIGMEPEPLTEREVENGTKLRAALDAARKTND